MIPYNVSAEYTIEASLVARCFPDLQDPDNGWSLDVLQPVPESWDVPGPIVNVSRLPPRQVPRVQKTFSVKIVSFLEPVKVSEALAALKAEGLLPVNFRTLTGLRNIPPRTVEGLVALGLCYRDVAEGLHGVYLKGRGGLGLVPLDGLIPTQYGFPGIVQKSS